MSGLAERIQSWFMRENDRAYLSSLSNVDLADLGLSRSDVAELAHSPLDVRERMIAMAEHHGVEAQDVDASRQFAMDIARACANCGEVRQCARYLDGGDGNPKVFCPNSGRFDEIAAQGR